MDRTARLKRAARKLEKARVERDLEIREAAAEKMPLRSIGAAVDLSHQRVAQIIEAGAAAPE